MLPGVLRFSVRGMLLLCLALQWCIAASLSVPSSGGAAPRRALDATYLASRHIDAQLIRTPPGAPTRTAAEAAAALGLSRASIVKSLVFVEEEKELAALVLVRGDDRVSEQRLSSRLGGSWRLASDEEAFEV